MTSAALALLLTFSPWVPVQDPPAPAQDAETDAGGPRLIPASEIEKNQTAIKDIQAHRIAPLDYVRQRDGYVPLDLPQVDIEADPVLTIDGRPVTNDEFRRRAIVMVGMNEVEKHILQVIARQEMDRQIAAGEAAEADFAVDEAMVDAKLDEIFEMVRMQATSMGPGAAEFQNDPAAADAAGEQAIQDFLTSVETSIGMEAYRKLLIADALFERVFLPIPEFIENPRDEDDPNPITQPSWMPDITWEALGATAQGQTLRTIAIDTDLADLPAFFKNSMVSRVRSGILDMLGVEWFFDRPLPPDVLLEVGGTPVKLDDVWFLAKGKLTDLDTELTVRELITLDAMKRRLEAEDAWLTDDEFAEAWAAHDAEFEGTLFPLESIIMFRGYYSLDRYREHYRYKVAHQKWRERDFSEEAAMDHYQTGGRLFFERGSCIVDLAFNPISGKPYTKETFAEAAAEMEAFLDEHGGDPDVFKRLQEKFPPPLSRQGGGGRAMQRAPLRMRMAESELAIMINGYAVSDDMYYHGVPGQIFGPWAQTCRHQAWGAEANSGVWMGRVVGYTRGRPLPKFIGPDRDMAIEDYHELTFLDWAQDTLREALSSVEVSG